MKKLIIFTLMMIGICQNVHAKEKLCFDTFEECKSSCNTKMLYDIENGDLFYPKETDFFYNCSLACEIAQKDCVIIGLIDTSTENISVKIQCLKFASIFEENCPKIASLKTGHTIFMNNLPLICREITSKIYTQCIDDQL
jgi:hypothetical protein